MWLNYPDFSHVKIIKFMKYLMIYILYSFLSVQNKIDGAYMKIMNHILFILIVIFLTDKIFSKNTLNLNKLIFIILFIHYY